MNKTKDHCRMTSHNMHSSRQLRGGGGEPNNKWNNCSSQYHPNNSAQEICWCNFFLGEKCNVQWLKAIWHLQFLALYILNILWGHFLIPKFQYSLKWQSYAFLLIILSTPEINLPNKLLNWYSEFDFHKIKSEIFPLVVN